MRQLFVPLQHYGFSRLERTEAGYRIEALLAGPPGVCPYCASADLAGFGRRVRNVADVPLAAQPVLIAVLTRRFRCGACGRTFSETLPEIDPRRHMTLRLKRWIKTEATHRTGVSIAAEAGLSEGTVRKTLRDAEANQ